MSVILPHPLVAPIMPTEITYSSGVIPMSTNPCTGELVRSKRSGGSSDDKEPQPDSDGFIESDLRAGGPTLCESPCWTDIMPANHPIYKKPTDDSAQKVDSEAVHICLQEGLKISSALFCLRRSTFNPGDAGIPTLLNTVRRGDHRDRGWISVARKVQQHLYTCSITQVAVEIIDPAFALGPSIFPVCSRHPIYRLWESVTDAVLHEIDLEGICNINCFRIGAGDEVEKCPVTVLVGTDRHVRRDWKNVREAIIIILARYDLVDVGVMIRKDRGLSRMVGDYASPILTHAQCTKHTDMGYSLSPRKSPNSQGTFGGWVQLRSPETNQWVDLGITYCHCVFPRIEDVSVAERDAIRAWSEKGVKLCDANRVELLSLDSPSKDKLNSCLNELDRRIRKLREDECFSKVEKAKMQGDSVIPSDESVWKTFCDIIMVLEQQRNKVSRLFQEKQHHLGEVFYASGLKEQPVAGSDKSSICDWALILPGKDRKVGSNKIPVEERNHLYFSELPGFSPSLPRNGEELSKVGQTTGFTVGLYSGPKGVLIATRTENDKEKVVVTREHCFTGCDQRLFEGGDSGSLVFEKSTGWVMGLLFGGSETCDIGYFTSTVDLVEHIERVTGAKEV